MFVAAGLLLSALTAAGSKQASWKIP